MEKYYSLYKWGGVMPSKISIDNSSIFATRLTELRKDKKVSQKQAAKDLGISQALLSHYENGVRECGLNFVVRAANYYSVSCDFLLGNSKSTVSLDGHTKILDIPEDATMSTDTIVRAALSLGNRVVKDEELVKYVKEVYGLSTYLVLYAGIKKGAIPSSWMDENLLNPDVAFYLAHSLGVAVGGLKWGPKKTSKEKVPQCISTVASWTNDYLNLSIASLL